MSILHQDRLFPAEPATRSIARRLYETVRDLPIISPHGHTDARWFAENESFPDPTTLFIVPDHYVFRMLYSQGVAMEDLGIGKKELNADEARKIWVRFAENYYLIGYALLVMALLAVSPTGLIGLFARFSRGGTRAA